MSTEIKNTLFRFVSMRAPELLEKEQVDQRFVKYPEGYGHLSLFLKDLQSVAAKDKKSYIAGKAATHSDDAWTTREEVRSLSGSTSEFYDFAIWLSSNRATITKAQLNEKLPLSSPITTPVAIQLWDNLFYQITTLKSGYVREAILSVLVADFFLKNMVSAKGTKNLRKLAKARVIIPKELFGLISVPSKELYLQKHLDKLETSTRHLDADAKRGVAASRVAELQIVAGELKKAQTDFERSRARLLKEAQENYAHEVRNAYENTSPETQTYKDERGLTMNYKRFPDVKLPEVPTSTKEELDDDFLSRKLSPDSFAIVTRLKENGAQTFGELLETIDEGIRHENETLFSGHSLRRANTYIEGGRGNGSGGNRGGNTGTGTGTGNNPATTTTNPVFNINSAGVTSSRRSSLLMVMDNMPAGVDVIGARYIATSNSGTIFVGEDDFTDSWVNGKLHVTIFNANKIDTDNPQFINLAGELHLSNGDKIEIEGKCNIVYEYLPYLGGGTERFYKGNGVFTYVPLNITDDNGEEVITNPSLIEYKPSGFGVKRLGITDYRKVEQEVCCYVPGEVSNIENVMAREYKEKSTRRLRRTEDTLTTSKEQEKEKLTDTSTTDRFEMNREASNLIAEDTSLGAHTSFTSSWGGNGSPSFGLQAGADFAHNTTKEQSDSQAITQAKEITERTLDRVVQKVKEERVIKMIEEYEENNKHGYDNREGNQHISGVYRWVDKVYRNKIVNYGKRLMYEFMIPEPAAFHDIAVTNKGLDLPEEPLDPRKGDGLVRITSHKDITAGNYQHWAAVYNADVKPRPEGTIYLGKSFVVERSGDSNESYSKNDSIEIPEGYAAASAKAIYSAHWDNDNHDSHMIAILFGDLHEVKLTPFNNVGQTSYYDISAYRKEVPVSYQYYNYHSGSINISVIARLTNEADEQWKVETFNAIISAYQKRKDEYDARVAELKGAVVQKVAQNPLFYRQIENMSLRKNCIAYLADHANMGGMEMLSARGTMGVNAVYKEERLEKYAAFVKFFEQAFEWDLMSYYFYPFYWANQAKWKDLYNIENDDPLFRSFLQSGMARVILTVRPGFEETVNWYMATGQIWNGGQVPTLDDPLFLSIVEELKEAEGQVEDTWESRVPTSLTVLQAGTIGLDVTGLPCDPDCDEYKIFNEEDEVVKTLTNPISQKKFEIGKSYGDDGEETPQTPQQGE